MDPNPPTTADFAYHNAQDAQRDIFVVARAMSCACWGAPRTL